MKWKDLLRWWHKQFVYDGIDNIIYGKFRVKYENGCTTLRMCYKAAREYVAINGGKIIDAF